MRVYLEALSPHQKANVDTWKVANHTFSDHAFGGSGHARVEIPLAPPKSEHKDDIAKHLAGHGYHITDYRAGLAEKHIQPSMHAPVGSAPTVRIQKIGKLLHKHGAHELLKRFETDPARNAKDASGNEYHVVISRHPHDVAGMTSKGHSWCDSSCMNFETGSNRKYLRHEVAAGTHVAYLAKKTDTHLDEPLARIAIKPLTSISGLRHKVLRPEKHTYGDAPDSFHRTVSDWAERYFPMKDGHIYSKIKSTYSDGMRTVHFVGQDSIEKGLYHKKKNISDAAIRNLGLAPSALHRIFTSNKEMPHRENVEYWAMQHANLQPETASHIIEQGSRDGASATHYDRMARLVGQRNTDVSAEVNDLIVNQYRGDPERLSGVASRYNLHPRTISKLIDRGHGAELVGNPNLEPGHIDKIQAELRDPVKSEKNYHSTTTAHERLILNMGALSHHVDAALDHAMTRDTHSGGEQLVSAALRSPGLASHHIDRILGMNHPIYSGEVADSGQRPAITREHIDTLLDQADMHGMPRLASSAIRNHNPASAQIHRAIDIAGKGGSGVYHSYRDIAAAPNLEGDHLHKLIDHIKERGFDHNLVGNILYHPKATADHYSAAIEKVPAMHTAIARDERLQPEHYAALMQTPAGRFSLASNNSLPKEHLDMLHEHFSHETGIASSLVDHPKTSAKQLAELAKSYGVVDSAYQLSAIKHHFLTAKARFATPEYETERIQVGRNLLGNQHAENHIKGFIANAAMHLIPAEKASSQDLSHIISHTNEHEMGYAYSIYLKHGKLEPHHIHQIIGKVNSHSNHHAFHARVLQDSKARFSEADYHDIKTAAKAPGAHKYWTEAANEVG